MQQLLVSGLSAAFTHLGYGCSQLMGGITRRESIALLEAAFDAGIRHFDTAPSYGYGHAESVLGEVIYSKRDRVTIATKFGLQPPRNRRLLATARSILLPMLRRVPSVKSRLSRTTRGLVGRAHFSAGELRKSIDASLAALRTDYIDILLLHEAVLADLSDELFGALEGTVKEGKIRAFGVGSERVAADEIYHGQQRFCPIMQFEWSVLSREKLAYPGSFLITHRSLSDSLVRLRAWLTANPQVVRSWSAELDLDVSKTSVLSSLMLAAARHANPGGITLFSSRSPQNISKNARFLVDDFEAGAAFAALVARDAATLLKAPQSAIPSAVGVLS
jgi:D-threo-aldose 1-dehydrogenase